MCLWCFHTIQILKIQFCSTIFFWSKIEKKNPKFFGILFLLEGEGVRPKHTKLYIYICVHRRRFYLCTYHINFISTVIKELYYTNDRLNIQPTGLRKRHRHFEYLRMNDLYTHIFFILLINNLFVSYTFYLFLFRIFILELLWLVDNIL